MADQKIDPNRPKDDKSNVATSHVPTASTPPSGLAPGPQTLEAQRAAFKTAEAGVAATLPPSGTNPLAVSGVDADVQTALQNPAVSGGAATKTEDVQKTADANKEAIKKQASDVKSAPAPATVSVAAPVQPAGAQPPAPAKVDNPVEAAKAEGQAVQAGDPANQHATEAQGNAPQATQATAPSDVAQPASTPAPAAETTAVPKSAQPKRPRGRPRKNPLPPQK